MDAAASAYHPSEHELPVGYLVGLITLAAFAGASLRGRRGPRRGDTRGACDRQHQPRAAALASAIRIPPRAERRITRRSPFDYQPAGASRDHLLRWRRAVRLRARPPQARATRATSRNHERSESDVAPFHRSLPAARAGRARRDGPAGERAGERRGDDEMGRSRPLRRTGKRTQEPRRRLRRQPRRRQRVGRRRDARQQRRTAAPAEVRKDGRKLDARRLPRDRLQRSPHGYQQGSPGGRVRPERETRLRARHGGTHETAAQGRRTGRERTVGVLDSDRGQQNRTRAGNDRWRARAAHRNEPHR